MIPRVAASEIGRAQTEGEIPRGYGSANARLKLAERFWESLPKEVKAPYAKAEGSKRTPEYRETRGTLREVGGTTPQG